jgi:alpha-L-fucosidase
MAGEAQILRLKKVKSWNPDNDKRNAMKLRIVWIGLLCIVPALTARQPIDRTFPSSAQLEWADAEIGALIHFDMPVFEPGYDFRADWNYHPDPAIFNPQALDTDQWVQAAKSAGATYVILVAKHCSGFSLWPTKAHPYSVKNAPWKNGEGDIVREFIASCKKFGLKPGIYASTTANGYLKVDNPGRVVSGDPAEQQRYNEIVRMQLAELWSQYGELFEVWFDGGVLPVEKGGFDVLSLLRQYQPDAIAFQGPYGFENNIRWVGNEEGVAPYPCWARADSVTSSNGVIEIKGLNGNPDGLFWCPGESDFPLRENSSFQGGWFWHRDQDDRLRSLDELEDRYCKSVGRNTNMLLGIVIDDRGLVPDADVKRLAEFGQLIRDTFAVKLGETRGRGQTCTLRFASPRPVKYVEIMEAIAKGERIREYQLSGLTENKWLPIAAGTSVGHKRIEKISAGTFSAIRLEITASDGEPEIKSLACYGQ